MEQLFLKQKDIPFVELTIRSWFTDYRPDIATEMLKAEKIAKMEEELKEDLNNLPDDNGIKRMFIEAYLKLNYPTDLGDLVDEVLEEMDEENEEWHKVIEDWKNFAFYTDNKGNIMYTLSMRKIPEKYMFIDDDATVKYREEIKDEIKTLALEYIGEWGL